MTRRAFFWWFTGTALIAGVILSVWWPEHQAAEQAKSAVSLKAAWEARSLTLYPDGCLQLRDARGSRTFLYVGKTWRECPKKKGR